MYSKELETRILTFFLDNKGKMFTLKDLAIVLKLGKHKYKDLSHTISGLLREKKITKINHGFGLMTPTKAKPSKPVPAPLTAGGLQTQSSDVIEEVMDTPDSPPPKNWVEGTFDATPLARNNSFAFVLTPDYDVYVSAEDTLDAYHRDKVIVEVKTRRGDRYYGIVRKIVTRSQSKIVGNVFQDRSGWFLQPDNPKIHGVFGIRELGGADQGKKAVLDVTFWGSRRMSLLPYGNIIEVLGDSGNPEIEVLGVIRGYDLPLTFPSEVLAELTDLSAEIPASEIERRRDFRNLLTLTIDPISAKDYDDAISLETRPDGWRLYVHIADVSWYVKPGSAVFAEALIRGNSYYFPRRVLPMLPERLSNLVCSLRPDEEKLTQTVITDIDKSGKITHQSVCESVIKSDARLVYEDVDLFFDDKPHPIPEIVIPMLKEMRRLSSVLSKKREKKGCLYFDLPEVEYFFDEDGYVTHLGRSTETESHALIENFMLIANEYIAGQLEKKKIPSMYRIHEEPDPGRIFQIAEIISRYGYYSNNLTDPRKILVHLLRKVENPDYHRVFDRQILRSLKKARYTVDVKPHFGLAIDTYTHFTSPIRRLCDLLVHHLTRQHLVEGRPKSGKGTSPLFSREDMFRWSGVASDREIVADEAERDVNRVNIRHFMKGKIGETYSGLVVHITANNLVIELDSMPVTGVVRVNDIEWDRFFFDDRFMRMVGRTSGRSYRLMDHVKVILAKVEDDIYFAIEAPEPSEMNEDLPKPRFRNDRDRKRPIRGQKTVKSGKKKK